MDLQAGLEGTAKQFYRRHQMVVVVSVVSLAGIATGTAAAYALSQTLIFTNVLLLSASAVAALVVAYALLRHWGFAALSVLAPLPGLIWAAPIASGSDFGSVPFLAYGLGLTFAVFYSEYRLSRFLHPEPEWNGGKTSLWGAGPLLPTLAAGGLVAIIALAWFRGGASQDAAWQVAGDSGLALATVLLLLPLGLSLLHFDEAFVARANRALEQRERWLEGLTFAAIPRWGLSITGITVILIVLGWYGARGVLQGEMLLRSLAIVMVVIVGGFVGGGWREGLALGGAVGAACLLTLWASVIASGGDGGGVVVLQSGGLTAVISLWGLWRARHFREGHETARAARERVLADSGSAVIAVVASAGALLPLLLVHSSAVVALLGVGFAGLAGVLLVPALATGLEALAPRRATVEQLYGSKRPRR